MMVKLNYSDFHGDNGRKKKKKRWSLKDQNKSATAIKSANAAKLKDDCQCC